VSNGGGLKVCVDYVSGSTAAGRRPECQDAGFDGSVDPEDFGTLHLCVGGAALPPGC
jgi:hypothetical protein